MPHHGRAVLAMPNMSRASRLRMLARQAMQRPCNGSAGLLVGTTQPTSETARGRARTSQRGDRLVTRLWRKWRTRKLRARYQGCECRGACWGGLCGGPDWKPPKDAQ
jgi:hypothetical protein